MEPHSSTTHFSAYTPPFFIGAWRVDPALNTLAKDGVTHQVEPKMMQVLVCLADDPGRVVSRAELHTLVWPDTVVTPKALTVIISKLRKLLGDDPQQPAYIETISKNGYRLIAPVRYMEPSLSGDSLPAQVEAQLPLMVRRPWWFVGAMVGVLVLALAIGFWRDAPDAAPTRVTQLTTSFGHELNPALSPDGNEVAYAWQGESRDNWDIYVLQPGSSVPLRRTTHPGEDLRPTWSPDGTEIAFLRFGEDACGLYIMPALAGPEQRVLPCNEYMTRGHLYFGPGLAWSPDGTWIALSYKEAAGDPLQLYRFDVETQTLTPLTQTPPRSSDWYATFAPSGNHMAFARATRSGTEVMVLDVASGEETQLTNDYRGVLGITWMPNETDLLFASNRRGPWQLWRIPYTGGKPRWLSLAGWNLKQPTTARIGSRMVYENWAYDNNIWRLALTDTVAMPERFLASTLWENNPAYSPDGSRVAFLSNRSGHYEIWVANADGTNPRQVTRLEGPLLGQPAWSPDGEYIAFDARPKANSHVYIVPISGSVAHQLTQDTTDVIGVAWATDSQSIYFGTDRSGGWRVWNVARAGGEPVQVVTEPSIAAQQAPDGSLYVVRTDTTGLWRQAAPNASLEQVVPSVYIDDDNWVMTPAGIYYPRYAPTRSIRFYDFDTQSARTIAPLPETFFSGLSISPDGRYMVYTQLDQTENDLMLVEGL